jgi:hypothetical protein
MPRVAAGVAPRPAVRFEHTFGSGLGREDRRCECWESTPG